MIRSRVAEMAKIRFCTLFSGSSANCTYVEVNGNAVLIDAGAGVKKTEQALRQIGSGYDKIRGVFVTHEHSDHISGLKTILKYHTIPVIANPATISGFYGLSEFEKCFCSMPTGSCAENGDFRITSFSSSHDSAECVGYVIETGKNKLGILTDCGQLSAEMMNALAGCEAVVLESNHDVDMLMNGSYPYPLKKRVAGTGGHLSNDQCAQGLCQLVHTGVKQVFLAHLSKENNTPQLALETVCRVLSKHGVKVDTDVQVRVAPRDHVSEMLEF